jgi:hypothetical protein
MPDIDSVLDSSIKCPGRALGGVRGASSHGGKFKESSTANTRLGIFPVVLPARLFRPHLFDIAFIIYRQNYDNILKFNKGIVTKRYVQAGLLTFKTLLWEY